MPVQHHLFEYGSECTGSCGSSTAHKEPSVPRPFLDWFCHGDKLQQHPLWRRTGGIRWFFWSHWERYSRHSLRFLQEDHCSRTHQLWHVIRKIYPRHNSLGARWEPLLMHGVLNRNLWCWWIQGPLGNRLGSSRAKKLWSLSGWHHQQGIRPGKVQVQVHVARLGSEIRKLSIHNTRGKWCDSVIHFAVSGSSWPNYIFPSQLYRWDNYRCATKRRPLPIWHKESIPDPQKLPSGWDIWTVDQ